MRRLGHLIILFAVIAVVFLLLEKMDFTFFTLDRNKDKQSLLETSSFSLTHRQINSQWTEFSLNQANDSIRLLSNAVIQEKYTSEIDSIWHYALEYQLIDKNNRLIKQQVYHHRSKITWLKNQQDLLQSQTFFLNNNFIPTSSSEILIKTASYPALAKIRVRTHSSSPQVQFVFFRLYERERVFDNKIEYLWQRLDLEERERISRFSVYGSDFLRNDERYQMLKYRWRPVGPAGIAGQDYQTEKLYINKDELIVPIEDHILSNRIDADKYYYHIIPVSEQGGTLSLQIKPVAEELNPDANNVLINWFGKGRIKREHFTFNLRDEANWEKQLGGGLIEVRTEQPVTIKSWLTLNGQRSEITPDDILVTAYALQNEQTLSYPINHVKNRSTSVKISIRALLQHAGQTAQPGAVNYSYFSQEKRISGGQIEPEFSRSFYDRILNASLEGHLSDPYHFYLNIPAQADRLELTSNEPVYINLYNRPADFYYRIRVPEDYYHSREIKHIRPVWFALQAEDQLELMRQRRRVLISSQPRPPQDEQIKSLAEYEWQDYFPKVNWQARYLFNPRNAELPVHNDALGVLYHRLPANQQKKLNFSSQAGLPAIEPALVFLRKGDKPSRIKVFVDGKLQLETYILASNGQLKLPQMSTGRHDLKIDSPAGVNWYINQSKGQENYYVKRLSTRIDKKTLNFDFYKNKDNMVLSGLFQSQSAATQRTLLQVSISPDKRVMKQQVYTLLNRQFDIRPDNSEAVKVLNTPTELVGKGQRFFIPLGADLPPYDNVVDINELIDYIGEWKLGNVLIGELIDAIGKWKGGC